MAVSGRHPERHGETVAAAADALGTIPLTILDLPPIRSERLEHRRSDALARLERAENQLSEVESELRDRRSAAARAGQSLAECDARSATARAELAAAIEERDATAAHLDQLHLDADALSAAIQVDTARLEHAASLREATVTAIDAVTGRPLDADRRAAAVARLREVAAELGASDVDVAATDDAAVALHGWAVALADGTAPLDPRAAALLERLDDLQQRWEERGSGDTAADPAVVAAREEVLAAQTALAELESQARTGVLGERARRAIEQAHATRTELEGRGKRADPDELARALRAEQEALAQVGFDSMLDFRVVMSSTGSGAIAAKQRELAEGRLAAATESLDGALASTKAAHDEMRAAAEALRTAIAELLGGDGPMREGLLGLHVVPDTVAGARAELITAEHAIDDGLVAAREDLFDLRSKESRTSERLAALEQAVFDSVARIDAADAERQAAEAQVVDSEAAMSDADARVRTARHERDAAAALLSELQSVRYVEDDVAELRAALLHAIASRAGELAEQPSAASADGPRGVVVDDPLDVLDAPDALAVFDAVLGIEWGAPVVYVSSRPELLARAANRQSSVRCIDGRRRFRRDPLRGLRRVRRLVRAVDGEG